jgi:enoyl-[acyl-carrier-protein] reductase (NADH)
VAYRKRITTSLSSPDSAPRYLAHDLGQEGIRVNAISAGPIRTLAASGAGDFRKRMEKNARGSLLRRNVMQDEVRHAAAIFVEKAYRQGHRVGQLTGVALIVLGLLLLGGPPWNNSP